MCLVNAPKGLPRSLPKTSPFRVDHTRAPSPKPPPIPHTPPRPPSATFSPCQVRPVKLLPTSARCFYAIIDPNHFSTITTSRSPLRAMQSPARQQGQDAPNNIDSHCVVRECRAEGQSLCSLRVHGLNENKALCGRRHSQLWRAEARSKDDIVSELRPMKMVELHVKRAPGCDSGPHRHACPFGTMALVEVPLPTHDNMS
jgi:hypothetical protein